MFATLDGEATAFFAAYRRSHSSHSSHPRYQHNTHTLPTLLIPHPQVHTYQNTDYYRVLRHQSPSFKDGKRAEEMANRVRKWEKKMFYDGDFILDDFMEED